MKLSIVTTLYKSALHIEEFYRRINKAAKSLTDDYEIIFVNDGSPDNSFDIARNLLNNDKRVTLIDLSRNFGHHKAIMAGLKYAKGERVFLIDSDLEEEPELLTSFWGAFNNDTDVVYGVQETRRGSLFERISGWLHYKTLNLISRTPIPENFLTIRLMNQRFVQALLLFKDQNLVFSLINELAGFSKKCFTVNKKSSSATSYNLFIKLSLFTRTIVSSTAIPLWLIFYFGFFVTCLSFIFVLHILLQALFFKNLYHGWPTIIISIWFFGGITTMFLGVTGIYIAEILSETKQHPQFIIREIFRNKEAPSTYE